MYKNKNMDKEISKTALEYYYDTSVGLWCIDQKPKDVSLEWIRENAFQLDKIKDNNTPKKDNDMNFTITPKEVSKVRLTKETTKLEAIEALSDIIIKIRNEKDSNLVIVGAVIVVKIETT